MATFGHRGRRLQRHPRSRGGHVDPVHASAGDLGKWLRVTVTYDDSTGTGLTTVGTQPVLSQPTLSNAGYAHSNLLVYGLYAPGPHLYAQRFTTGTAPARLPADGSTPRAFLGYRR